MKRLFRCAALALFAISTACSAGAGTGDAANVGHVTSALTGSPGLTPVPCSGGVSTWDGSNVDLLVADAIASCSLDGYQDAAHQQPLVYNTGGVDGFPHDAYLDKVYDLMISAFGTPVAPTIIENWIQQRGTYWLNCDPSNMSNGGSVAIEAHGVKERTLTAFTQDSEQLKQNFAADSNIRAAGFNFCIAQHLRDASPGSSGAEAILLSEEDQKLLLETARQRVQLAVTEYGLMGVALATDVFGPNADYVAYDSDHFIPDIQLWGGQLGSEDCSDDHCGPTRLKAMSDDFVSAVELDIQLTTEVSELMARSRLDGSLSSVASNQSRATHLWGPGSWFQRMMATLYGGDPFAIEAGGAWELPLSGHSSPGFYTVNNPNWPSALEEPYFDGIDTDPHVNELINLAQATDSLELEIANDPDCSAPERTVPSDDAGQHLYDNVERALVFRDCNKAAPTSACPTLDSIVVPPTIQDHLLWQRYRMTPDHAASAVQYLSQAIGSRRDDGSWMVAPARNIHGSMTTKSTIINGVGACVVKLNKDQKGNPLTFKEHELGEIAPRYQALNQVRFATPADLYPFRNAWQQGFDMGEWFTTTSAGRAAFMGAIPALVATRDMVTTSLTSLAHGSVQNYNTDRLSDYFSRANDVIKLINQAIGKTSVTVRPQVIPDPNSTNVTQSLFAGEVYLNDLVITYDDDDTYYTGGAKTADISNGNGHNATNLALAPGSTIDGQSDPGSQLLLRALGTDYEGASAPDEAIAGAEDAPHRIVYKAMPLGFTTVPPSQGEDTSGYNGSSIVASRNDVTAEPYRLLLANVADNTGPMRATQIAGGGQLGAWLERQLLASKSNPVEPAYDGFGLPTDLVPPTDPNLFADSSGTDPVAHYLTQAKSAAQTATDAVKTAFDDLLKQETDQAALASARQKDDELASIEKKGLCGDSNTSCNVGTVNRLLTRDMLWGPVTVGGNGGPPDCTAANQDPTMEHALDCFALRMLPANGVTFSIAKPVSDHLNDAAQPAFADFAGGSLQAALIEQWAAVHGLIDVAQQLTYATQTAKANLGVFEDQVTAQDDQVKADCSGSRMDEAALAGSSVSTSVTVGADLGFTPSVSVSCSFGIGFTPGPLIAQGNKCQDEATANGVGTTRQQVIAGAWQALQAIAQQGTQLGSAMARLQTANATIRQLVGNAGLATERDSLDAKYLGAQQLTSFGLYRRYTSYDIWRAKALLENARRYAVLARRAIESRFVVNLSTMTADEPLVAAPATWADEIYQYDLNMPAAVGVETGSAVSGGIAPNRVADYVDNLQRFVDGFAIQRPSAVTHEDREIISLPAPSGNATPIGGSTGSEISGGATADAWSFFCPDSSGGVWQALPASRSADSACGVGSHPTFAKIVFGLDPWGRVNGDIAQEPFDKRYNTRWTNFAINLVGTGVKDCTKAADPQQCYAETFVRYNLSQVGPAWVSNFDEQWHVLGVPVGQVEGAKALAAEVWWDAASSNWTTPLIQGIARSEFNARPIGGSYEIKLEVTPQLILDNIQRIQLLSGTGYWVKQQ